ncbi:small GTPase [Tieghemostelium lacteum]|uniref:Small GTPase n=1 Tax=Tieghemostelium lacteum TaxID=361077 RepID=A0A151ZBW6_TIELA|nr:small GTPase [Tieghemostelium lacteum]|eukprot:KYQ91443.1 small GTPase [Tieghemostelium lacteum]
MNNNSDISLKIVVVGDTGNGKSSLIWRFCEGTFPNAEQSNITVLNSIKSKAIQFGKKQLVIKFHDTAGQERFRTISRSFYSSTDIIILTYDASVQASFEHVSLWYNEIQRYSNNPKLYIALASTKSDLPAVVDSTLGQKLADEKKIPFFETSSLNNEGVDDLLQHVIKGAGEKIYTEENWNRFKVRNEKDHTASRKPTQMSSINTNNNNNNNNTEPKKSSFCIIL